MFSKMKIENSQAKNQKYLAKTIERSIWMLGTVAAMATSASAESRIFRKRLTYMRKWNRVRQTKRVRESKGRERKRERERANYQK